MFLADRDVVYIDSVHKPAPLAIPVRAKQQIIAAHHTLAHLPRLAVKGPILQAIASLPSHSIIRILVLVPELHRDPIIPKSEQLLAQAIIVLALPLGCEKLDNGVCAGEKEGTVTPDTIRSVGLRDPRGIPCAWLVRVDVLRGSLRHLHVT